MSAASERMALAGVSHAEFVRETRRLRALLCRGCFYLSEREQIQFHEDDGRTPISPPRRMVMPCCTRSGLHLEYMDRIIMEVHRDRPSCDNHWVRD
jgi:hypothetical protein